jgi:hypothetical protein
MMPRKRGELPKKASNRHTRNYPFQGMHANVPVRKSGFVNASCRAQHFAQLFIFIDTRLFDRHLCGTAHAFSPLLLLPRKDDAFMDGANGAQMASSAP